MCKSSAAEKFGAAFSQIIICSLFIVHSQNREVKTKSVLSRKKQNESKFLRERTNLYKNFLKFKKIVLTFHTLLHIMKSEKEIKFRTGSSGI